jgi:hypothetical protein
MKEILKYSWGALYTDLISFSVALVGLIISIWKGKQNPRLKPLFFFFLAYVLDLFICRLTYQNRALFNRYDLINLYIDSIDTVIEFLAFFFLLKNHIASVKIKRALNPLFPFFLISICTYYIFYTVAHPEIDEFFKQNIFTLQAVCLVTACILYYIDLFNRKPVLNLTALPSFWAITGLSFFMLCTLPFSVLGFYLLKTNYALYRQLFSIFNIFYCILFLMIIKAYLCKPSID